MPNAMPLSALCVYFFIAAPGPHRGYVLLNMSCNGQRVRAKRACHRKRKIYCLGGNFKFSGYGMWETLQISYSPEILDILETYLAIVELIIKPRAIILTRVQSKAGTGHYGVGHYGGTVLFFILLS